MSGSGGLVVKSQSAHSRKVTTRPLIRAMTVRSGLPQSGHFLGC
jgi:hypothetical protein